MIKIDLKKNLNASFGNMLLQIQCELPQQQLITLYGKSGVGKTSTLRILAGLLKPEAGKIIVGDEVWLDSVNNINISPQKRKVGFVFQDYALFPNMTVKENLRFALAKNQDPKVIQELIEIIELGELRNRKPYSLSGGQQQRVALARALVQKPKLLLLDEPLSALDAEMRHKLQKYLLHVHQEFQLTTILISHDISEIVRLSDHVLMIEKGKIIRQSSPVEIFSHQELGGKIQFVGEIVSIDSHGQESTLTLLLGQDLVRIQVENQQLESLQVGDKIQINSNTFEPNIKKID